MSKETAGLKAGLPCAFVLRFSLATSTGEVGLVEWGEFQLVCACFFALRGFVTPAQFQLLCSGSESCDQHTVMRFGAREQNSQTQERTTESFSGEKRMVIWVAKKWQPLDS